MTTEGGTSEFQEFIILMPEAYEVSLTNDTVATAFFNARRAGWDIARIAQAASEVLASPKGGVGLLISRLRTLGENPPARRARQVAPPSAYMGRKPECQECRSPYRQTHTAVPDGTTCRVCGSPLVLVFYTGPDEEAT